MKYCLPYSRKAGLNEAYQEAEELRIRFQAEDTSLPTFLSERLNQTICLTIQIKDLDRCLLLYEKYKNIKLAIENSPSEIKKENLIKLQENKIPFFFMSVAWNWSDFLSLKNYHPTDLYVGGDLGFDIEQVSKVAKQENINIRVVPYIAVENSLIEPKIESFFIRPNDAELYENYIEVFDFSILSTALSIEQMPIIYNIYRKDKNWFGKLNEIIVNLNSDIDNRNILSLFGQARLGCGKRCLRAPDSCRICSACESTSKTLCENNLILSEKPVLTKDSLLDNGILIDSI